MKQTSTDGVLVCQACAGDAPGGKCKNQRCVGGPIVEEIPDGLPAAEEQRKKEEGR